MPDSVMFAGSKGELNPFDLPGPTVERLPVRCGQVVRDHREVEREGQVLCKPCAGGAYFSDAREIIFPDMHWSPYASLENPEEILSHLFLEADRKAAARKLP
jgi:formylmethanofuran dehydrogenase subunit E